MRREVRAEFGVDSDEGEEALLRMEGGRGEGMVEAERRVAEEEEEEEAPRINVDIPRCVAQLGSDLYFVKLPNFLSVETRYREHHLAPSSPSWCC